MDIKVIGMGCSECDSFYANVSEAIKNLSLDVEAQKVEDLVEIVKLGVMQSPALMINGRLVIAGRSAKVSEIERILMKFV